jgi:hypothetical protein
MVSKDYLDSNQWGADMTLLVCQENDGRMVIEIGSQRSADGFVVRADIAGGFTRDTVAQALKLLTDSVVDEQLIPDWPK